PEGAGRQHPPGLERGADGFAIGRGRHCEEQSDEAIHLSTCGAMDCFASLAMTIVGWGATRHTRSSSPPSTRPCAWRGGVGGGGSVSRNAASMYAAPPLRPPPPPPPPPPRGGGGRRERGERTTI